MEYLLEDANSVVTWYATEYMNYCAWAKRSSAPRCITEACAIELLLEMHCANDELERLEQMR